MLVRSPTLTNSDSSVTITGSRPDSRSARPTSTGVRRSLPSTARAIAAMCAGRGAAAAAHDVEEAGVAELRHDRGGLLGGLVVLAEGVGQAGVGVAGHERVGDARQLGQVGPHLLGAERAVEAHGDRAGVPHGVPERLGHLPRQGAAGGVGDGAGDDHRPAAVALLEERLDREDRRLGVEGVEDRLDDQQVGAAVDEAVGRLEVRRDQLVVRHVAGTGVVHVGRDRRGPRRRAERAGDVARALGGPRGHLVAHRAGQLRRLEVELVGELLHAVVGQRDRVGVEGVGLDEVGAGLEVLAVDAGDDVRLGEREQVVVADQVARPVREPLAAVARLVRSVPLDRRTHRTVDHEDALVERRGQLRGRIGANVRRIRHRGSSRRAGAVGPWWGPTSSVGRASGDRTAFPHGDTRVSAPGNRRSRPDQGVSSLPRRLR